MEYAPSTDGVGQLGDDDDSAALVAFLSVLAAARCDSWWSRPLVCSRTLFRRSLESLSAWEHSGIDDVYDNQVSDSGFRNLAGLMRLGEFPLLHLVQVNFHRFFGMHECNVCSDMDLVDLKTHTGVKFSSTGNRGWTFCKYT